MKLQLQNVEKMFGSKRVLNIQALTCENSITFLSGSNGSGKTTFLRVLADILLPDKGTVQFSLQNSKSGAPRRAYFESGFMLYGELTVKEHAQFVEGLSSCQASKAIFSHFGLVDREHELVSTLSKGWRARLALALCLSLESELLLLDEPLEALDREGRALLLTSLKEYAEKGERQVFIATHRKELFEGMRGEELLFVEGQQPEVVR